MKMYISRYKRRYIEEILQAVQGENIELAIFGSTISSSYETNRCRPDSDIDICIKTPSKETFLRCHNKISMAISGRTELDILWWNSLSNPMLMENIRKGGLLKKEDRICCTTRLKKTINSL